MFWKRKRPLSDFQEEIRSHLEHDADDLQDPNAAKRAFGNITGAEERYYERSRWVLWDHLRQDARYALRTLCRTPVFTLAAIATLALGIGANAAIFSVLRAVLLKPLPYSDPQRIMVLETFSKSSGRTGSRVSAPDFHDWRRQSQTFEYMAYFQASEVTAIVNGLPLFTRARAVTPDFFAIFGLPPEAGRFWSAKENATPLAVVASEWAWEHFGSAQSAIGKAIRVNGKAVEVVGVTQPAFRYPGESDVWISAGLFEENTNRTGHNYLAVGRLKTEVSLAAARQEMRAIGDRLEQEYKENKYKTVAVTPLSEKLAASAQTTLWVLMAAALGVLLVGCANVANLQLARAASRYREMAVRAALGAGRGRILRQMLTESTILGVVGGVLGLGLASLLLKALLIIAPSDIPRLNEVEIDRTVLYFSLTLAGLCSLLFGMAPARKSAVPDLNSGLRQNSAKGSIGLVSGRMRSALVIAEVALSMILLASAGLLMRSFVALTQVDLGFSTDRLLLTRTSIPVQGEEQARRATEFQRELLSQISTLPGVRRAAGARTTPFATDRANSMYFIDGRPAPKPGEGPLAQMQIITPRYFETVGVGVLRGRDFSDGDAWGRPQVAIINQSLAREAFGEENPLGRRISCGMSLQSMNWMEIIGVVKDARQIAPGEMAKPELFMPYLQHPAPGANLTLIVQTQLEPTSLSSAITQTARKLNPQLPVRFSTMDQVLTASLAYPRFRAVLIGCFALLAACLAVVGIYGVISYLVGQRTSEIGLRLALGARPVDVFRLVIGGSVRLVIWGLALGLAGTLALSHVLQTLLFSVGPQDPLTIGLVIATLGMAALLGSSVPALRAARVDPLVALRQD
jgi:putative ABC transport system permease protein